MRRVNGRCWARALGNIDLPKALADCNNAIHNMPHKEVGLDSRGLVRLRMGDYAGAVADYTAALTIDPKIAWSLYGRGLAKLKLGDKAGGEADIAAAKGLAPKLADRAARFGIMP
jgi:tetratricopeptide (TPR) repeat protein